MRTIQTKILALALGACVMLTGCTPAQEQQTVVQLTQSLGAAVTSLLEIEGNTTAAAKLKIDLAAAVSAETNWKSGTPAQDVIEALNILQDDLNLLPVSPQDTALIDLGIGVVDQLLALLPQPATTTTAAAPAATLKTAAFYQAAPKVKHRHPGLVKPILSAKEFKKRWNELVKQHPELEKAKVK